MAKRKAPRANRQMAKTIDIDCTPEPKGMMMAEKGAAGMGAAAAINELIDNSLDAGAKTVRISKTNDNRYIIADDGTQGFENQDALVNFMRSGMSASRFEIGKSGQYGVGGKLAIQYFGSEFCLLSKRRGKYYGLKMDRDDIERTNKWLQKAIIPSDRELLTLWSHFSINEKRDGVIIEINQGPETRRFRPNDMAQAIGKTFAPALIGGANIELLGRRGTDNSEVRRIAPQWFTDTCSQVRSAETISYDNGAAAEVTIFRTHRDVERYEWRGVSISARHRFVILNDDREIFPAEFGRYAVYVKLIDGDSTAGRWELDTHKSSLRETSRRASLFEDLKNIIAPILQEASREAEQYDHKVFINQVSSIFGWNKIGNGNSHDFDENGDPIIRPSDFGDDPDGDGTGPEIKRSQSNIANVVESTNGTAGIRPHRAGPLNIEFAVLGGLAWRFLEDNGKRGKFTVYLDEKIFGNLRHKSPIDGAIRVAIFAAILDGAKQQEKARRYLHPSIVERIKTLPGQWDDRDYLSVAQFEAQQLGIIPPDSRRK